MTTTTYELPITKMLEEKKELYSTERNNKWGEYNIVFIDEIIPQVRQLEQGIISKAKKEEIDRIVEILQSDIRLPISDTYDNYLNIKLQQAITSITNQP